MNVYLLWDSKLDNIEEMVDETVMNKEYGARMTGAGFLFHEIKAVSKLIIAGVSTKSIENEVFNRNLFQYSKPASIKRVYPLIMGRCQELPDQLLKLLETETIMNSKLINLLAIMEEDLLFKDFMIETVGDCYRKKDLLFGRANVYQYLNAKAEQSSKVAGFKDSTRDKLRQVFLKILVEAGVLNKINEGELQPITLDSFIKEQLSELGYSYFISLLEGK